MKIILTGASGLLGSAFAKAANLRSHEVIGIVNSYNHPVDGLSSQNTLDLSDLAAVEAFTLEAFPDAIVNCAAISNPSQCDNDPTLSDLINVRLPEKLALLSRHLFARYIHISTDQVFDGRNPPYQIDSSTSPTSLYGQQKAKAEEGILEMAWEFASIVRIPLLSGNSPRGDRSLHEQLFRALSENERPTLFIDEFRQPCPTENVADVLVELCERNDCRGLIHWAGSQSLSRFQIGEKLLEHIRLPRSSIEQATHTNKPKFSKRPPDLTLDTYPPLGWLKTRPKGFTDHLDSLIVPIQFRGWYHSL